MRKKLQTINIEDINLFGDVVVETPEIDISDETGHNFEKLSEGILALSSALTWEEAKHEWKLSSVYQAGSPSTCLCGHNPIIEICVLKNEKTNKICEVGNRCVKRFLNLRSDLIFAGIKRVKDNTQKSLNEEATQFFYEQKVINDWEYGFQMDTLNKRKLSSRQIETRLKINKKVVDYMSKGSSQMVCEHD
ncbi:hypothetical protein [Brucella gallinifaecis]|uniref:hypothetical protein n=1 Tax=Brucella gallinifaecis TaxID=215590 RepID=UPI0023617129|nr:hypothetical protein [Brucella gallinifaecis]